MGTAPRDADGDHGEPEPLTAGGAGTPESVEPRGALTGPIPLRRPDHESSELGAPPAGADPVTADEPLADHGAAGEPTDEERFRVALLGSPVTVFNQDRARRYTWIHNPAGGLRPEDFLGRTAAELLPLAEAEHLTSITREVLDHDLAIRDEVRLTLGGETRVYDLRAQPLRAGGEVIGVTCTATDITERKRIEEGQRFLAAASALLATSLDEETTFASIARLAVPTLGDWCTVDLVGQDGSVRRVAAAHADPSLDLLAKRLIGLAPREDSPFGVAFALRTGEPVIHAHITDDVLASVASSAEHLRLLRALDERSAMVVPLNARGRTLGAIMVVAGSNRRPYAAADLPLAEDLARRAALALDNARLYDAQRIARVEAEAAEARYRGLLNGTADAVLVTDEAGQVLEINPAFTTLTGFTVADLRTLPPGRLAAPGPRWVELQMGRLLERGAWSGELEIRRKDWTIVPVEASVTAVQLPTGAVLMGVLRDITERRALARLEHEFIAMVSHELKSPLTAIKGFADMMRRDAAYNARAVETILSQANRLERLVDDLLETSRLAARRLDLRPTRINVATLANAAAERVRAVTSTHTVRVEGADHPIAAWGDEGRLEQIVGNLLSNAVKYAPAGTEVVVRIEELADLVRISVIDQGPGIAPELQAQVFERFYRAEGTAKRAQGLGLGLYVSRLLVEAHGGEIGVRSSPGQGSTFFFTIPRRRPAQSD